MSLLDIMSAQEATTVQRVLAWTGSRALQEHTVTNLVYMKSCNVKIVMLASTVRAQISPVRLVTVNLDTSVP